VLSRGYPEPTKVMPMLTKLRSYWNRLSLANQFAMAALSVLLPASVAAALWLPDKINEAVIKNTATATVLYMDGLIAPLVTEIRTSDNLSVESRQRLSALVEQSRQTGKIISIKIWRLDGTIIYSSFSEMIGKKFPLSEEMKLAKDGFLATDFENVAHEEDKNERAVGVPLLEVYAPIRDTATREIVAISEFYADATVLSQDLSHATQMSWLLIGSAMASLLGLLSMIVSRGSRTIVQQRKELLAKVLELRSLLTQNEDLRTTLRQSNESVSDMNERFLQRIGAELHDGPAQKLAYSVLRTSSVRKLLEQAHLDQSALDDIRRILQDAIKDVRLMSAGLMLPELVGFDLRGVVSLAARLHSDYSGTLVTLNDNMKGSYTNSALKTSVFRYVQEALTNAYKHAGGIGLSIDMDDRDDIRIVVSDKGQGATGKEFKKGLGLVGMQSRIFALGGKLDIESSPETGTRLVATFPKSENWN
jgi:signal transduction histidine kinase